jgi:DNA polymerase III epsilon subunit-like protein
MKYVSIDLETTGLDPIRNQILEFGAVIEDTENPLPYDELPTFQVYIDNGDLIQGNAYALQMNAAILKRIATKEEGFRYIKPYQLGEEFAKFLTSNWFTKKNGKVKLNVAGKNFGAFDLQFLNNCDLFTDDITISHRIIDPAMLYMDWETHDSLPNLTQCKALAGIAGEVTHNAVEDAIDVIKVLRPFYTKK